MDKILRAQVFRENLLRAMAEAGLNRSTLATRADLDRSTLGQLLQEDTTRLPNGHTLALLSDILGVSTDWLLGLSNESQPLTTFLDGALNFTPELRRSPMDENLDAWYREAIGRKVRTVPSTLPDPFKTQAVIEFEYKDYSVKTEAQAMVERDDRRIFTQLQETDMEICVAVQTFESFAFGTHVWQGLDPKHRKAQLLELADRAEMLYPSIRLYSFDQRTHYSVPFGVLGPNRAIIYLGQGYFVLNTAGHIRYMTRHFDSLVRNAVTHAHQMPEYLRSLAIQV